MLATLKSLPARVAGRGGARKPAAVLVILSDAPFDGDAAWNALRLAATLLDQGAQVRIFVMNDAIDLVREGGMPDGAEFDLQAMLRALLPRGARLKICTTCVNRCGIGQGEVIPEAIMATMGDLAAWVVDSDRVVVF
ncbi:MAG: DsrE family protein [Chloroflexi bacterium]|nr:DsrE family protein [Chloroflexota bacterium]MCZ7577575.1 DsrE family protein [Dehalococcoidia bacterium]